MKHSILVFSMIFSTACDPLHSLGLDSFVIKDVKPTTDVLKQGVRDLDVEFTAIGCEDFNLVEGNPNQQVLEIIPHERLPNQKNRFVAHLPLNKFLSRASCEANEQFTGTIGFFLGASCKGNGKKTREGDYVEVPYAISWRSVDYSTFESSNRIATLFPSENVDTVFFENGRSLFAEVYPNTEYNENGYIVPVPEGELAAPLAPGGPSAFAQRGKRGLFSGGCPLGIGGCGQSSVSLELADGGTSETISIPNAYVYEFEIDSNHKLTPVSQPLQIPGPIAAIAFEPSGDAVTLNANLAPATISVIAPDRTSSSRAFDGERIVGKFSKIRDGRNVFLTLSHPNQNVGRLRWATGALLLEFAVPGEGTINAVSIPLQTQDDVPPIAIIRGGKLWLRGSSGAWMPLMSKLLGEVEPTVGLDSSRNRGWGLFWLNTGIGFWARGVFRPEGERGWGGIDAFELNDGSARYSYRSPVSVFTGSDFPTETISGATGVGEFTVAKIQPRASGGVGKGLYIFDRKGELRGGAAGLPCRKEFVTDPIGLGDHRVAIASDNSIYIFDLERYRAP